MQQRPRSASGMLTGLAGLAGGIGATVLLHGWDQAIHIKTLIVLLGVTLPMIALELFYYRVHSRPSTGLVASSSRAINWHRVIQKLIGFWATIGIVAFAYWVLPEYATDYYKSFRDAALICLPIIALFSPFYIAYVDQRQVEPEDAYVQVSSLLGGHLPQDWAVLRAHALGWLVKAFFLPLMFTFVASNLRGYWESPFPLGFANFQAFYNFAYNAIFFCDVLIAAVGYTLTLRVLDGQIRSTEPTLLGWLVCLGCYPPLWPSLTSKYLAYDQDQQYWGSFFWDWPPLYILWGTLILTLIAIYAVATVSFGTRFSNLTHRGIISHGPYRWVKHPAYLTKNITWWLISVPFLTSGSWWVALQSSLLLVGVNILYYLRAITEERHLSRDPVYREYQAFIAADGLWARLRRLGKPQPPSALPTETERSGDPASR